MSDTKTHKHRSEASYSREEKQENGKRSRQASKRENRADRQQTRKMLREFTFTR